MAPHGSQKEDTPLEPAPITPGGTYTIQVRSQCRPFSTRLGCHVIKHRRSFYSQTVSVGCKIYIRRPGPDGKEEERLAEVLSIRDKPINAYTLRVKGIKQEEPQRPEDRLEFFVHWDQFNKRLDDWVPGSRLVLSRDLEWPRPKAPPPTKKAGTPKKPGKVPKSKSLLKKAATANAIAALKSEASTPVPSTPASRGSPSPAPSFGLKRKTPHDEDDDEDEDLDADAEGDMDIDGEGELLDLDDSGTPQPPAPLSAFSKEQEIEKLRTSGSMTQSISEIARVKNMNRLQIGKHEVDAWYFSPYPQEYAHIPILYICEFCLSYFASPFMLSRHRRRCNLLHPPGNEIYRHEDISFFELDGKRQLTWCRNLSLLSKCFLDQ